MEALLRGDVRFSGGVSSPHVCSEENSQSVTARCWHFTHGERRQLNMRRKQTGSAYAAARQEGRCMLRVSSSSRRQS